MTFPVPAFPCGPHCLHALPEQASSGPWLPAPPVEVGPHPPTPMPQTVTPNEARLYLMDAVRIHHKLKEYVLSEQPRLYQSLQWRFQRYDALMEFLNHAICHPPPPHEAWAIPLGLDQFRAADWGLNELLRYRGHPALHQLLTVMEESAYQAIRLKELIHTRVAAIEPAHSAALGRIDQYIHAMERARTLAEGQALADRLCTEVLCLQQRLQAPLALATPPERSRRRPPADAQGGPPPPQGPSATPFLGMPVTAARGAPPPLRDGSPRRAWAPT